MVAAKSSRKPMSVTRLHQMKAEGEKITMLTAYDASFAHILDQEEVDVILVGDSLGMVIQGHETTLPVTVDDIIYHAKAVARAIKYSLLLVDLPFMSYTSPQDAIKTSARLMQEGMGHMVKLEGGAPQVETVQQLTYYGVPVCAHLGLTPQSVHKLGGYRVQGREKDAREQMLEDAMALQNAGADAVVLECIPQDLATELTQALEIPTIGIGAGVDCDGQVLVLQDMLGITPRAPRFAKNFMEEAGNISGAVSNYVQAVKQKSFPSEQYAFK